MSGTRNLEGHIVFHNFVVLMFLPFASQSKNPAENRKGLSLIHIYTTIQKSEYEEHDLIRALVSTPPVNIVAAEPEQMPDEKGAFFKPEEGCIYVRKGMSAQEIFQNLVPELVFAGYADGNPHYDKNEDAFHVSCASYML